MGQYKVAPIRYICTACKVIAELPEEIEHQAGCEFVEQEARKQLVGKLEGVLRNAGVVSINIGTYALAKTLLDEVRRFDKLRGRE